MLLEMGSIIMGVPVGYALRERKSVIGFVDKANLWVIRTLLFLLGLSLGSDSNLMAQLDTLGVQAATISACAVFGSLLGAGILGRFLQLPDPPHTPQIPAKPESLQ